MPGSYTNTSWNYHLPSQPSTRAWPLHRMTLMPLSRTKSPLTLPPTKEIYQRLFGVTNKFQTSHDQRKVLVLNLNFTPITKVISRCRTFLVQAMLNHITLNQVTTHLQSWTTAWNLRKNPRTLEIHKNVIIDLEKFSSPRLLFTQTLYLDPMDPTNKEYNLTKNTQENGYMPSLLTHPSLKQSPQIDTLEAPSMPPPRLRFDAIVAACLARKVVLPGVHLTASNDEILSVY